MVHTGSQLLQDETNHCALKQRPNLQTDFLIGSTDAELLALFRYARQTAPQRNPDQSRVHI